MVGVFAIRLIVKKTREILTYNFVIRQRTFSATTFLLKVEPDEYFFMLVFFNSSELWKNISYRRLNFKLNVIQRRTIVYSYWRFDDLSCSYLTWLLRIPPNWMSKRESKQQAISGYLFRVQRFSWPALVLSLSLSDSPTSLSSTRLRLCHHTLHNDHHHHHLSLFILDADLTLPQWE